MGRNSLLLVLLFMLVSMSIFVPPILGSGEFNIGIELPDEPSIWDVLTFNAEFMWDAMTFSIADMPETFGIIMWVGSFLFIYLVISFVRGLH